jgi:LPS-assembly protein
VATGRVEALQGDRRLTATRIIFDRAGNQLVIEGPIRIADPDNGVIILADAAELDEGFRNGLLSGARMVLDQQLQLAAVEARRVGGRYTQLSRVAATSCQVCGEDGTPLWQIRASRVIHDQEERQLYFDNAQVRVMDVPVFWLPRLRLPDPTLDRARGLLFPTFTSGTLLGFGVKVPYFIPIGDHQDITLAPHLTTKSRSLELRYRRAFRSGNLSIVGKLSDDDFRNEALRGYVNASGAFSLPRDYRLTFDLNAVSDDAYLNDYDISGADRLASAVTLARIGRDMRLSADLVSYQTLRDFEENATQPGIIADLRYDRRVLGWRLPGELRFAAELHGHYRDSTLNVDGPDADTLVDGRDVARLNLEAGWHNRWTLGPGVRAGVSTYLWVDHFHTTDDAAVAREVSQATPGVAVELRWPMIRNGNAGGRSLLEPVLQYGWVGGDRPGNANDESTIVEFDEANLLSLSRFPAADRREHGETLAAGLRWQHAATQGWSAALTVGRIWQSQADPEFTRSSGLDSASPTGCSPDVSPTRWASPCRRAACWTKPAVSPRPRPAPAGRTRPWTSAPPTCCSWPTRPKAAPGRSPNGPSTAATG